MYTAYLLDPIQRSEMLSGQFQPLYSDVYAHHITCEFGVSKHAELPAKPLRVQIIGHANNTKGLEVYAVMVDGRHIREDGNIFHITWSLEKSVFKPKDSNTLIQKGFNLITPFEIKVSPALLR